MINPSFKELSRINKSRYAIACMVSKRARLLVDGSKPLIKKATKKPVTTALEEIMDDKVWESDEK